MGIVVCNLEDREAGGNLYCILEEALSDYGLAHRFYDSKMYEDTCFKAYDVAYKFIKAYALARRLELPDVGLSRSNLLELALNLGITDPRVLQELSVLSFIHVYFDYPELRVRSYIEFHEVIARRCLRAVKIIAYGLFKLKLQPGAPPSKGGGRVDAWL
jgi:HEPN domain-containing protein